MDDILKEVSSQIPAIVAFIVLVMVMLNFMRTITTDLKDVLERNTEALNRNAEALGHASAVFGKVVGHNNRHT